jgi:molybdate transport system permease protein
VSLSVAIYDHVEALEYREAHTLAAGMLAFSFIVLFVLYSLRAKPIEP